MTNTPTEQLRARIRCFACPIRIPITFGTREQTAVAGAEGVVAVVVGIRPLSGGRG